MIRRHNRRFDKNSCVLVAGDFFATREDMLIETVLGSCIAVCLYDDKNRVAGMNHFMLPSNRNPRPNGHDKGGRYGVNAMELLINEMMHLGADRYRMRAKVFGGGNVTRAGSGTLRIGDWNTEFALRFLSTEGIPVVNRDVGGETGRRIVLFTSDGKVKLRRLGGREIETVLKEETRYRSRIEYEPRVTDRDGEVTFFETDKEGEVTLF